MRCFARRKKITSKIVVILHWIGMSLSILVEDKKRTKELCNFLIVEMLQTLINSFKSFKKIKNDNFDKIISVF